MRHKYMTSTVAAQSATATNSSISGGVARTCASIRCHRVAVVRNRPPKATSAINHAIREDLFGG